MSGTDYSMMDWHAREIIGATGLPLEIRKQVLERFAERHGRDELIELFAQFIGLANSVVENNREMIEVVAITEFKCSPKVAEQINLPTIFGALNGVLLSNKCRNPGKTCEGCAFRLGTPANQSAATTCDANWCVSEYDGPEKFFCHVDMNEDGTPKHECAGFAQT